MLIRLGLGLGVRLGGRVIRTKGVVRLVHIIQLIQKKLTPLPNSH